MASGSNFSDYKPSSKIQYFKKNNHESKQNPQFEKSSKARFNDRDSGLLDVQTTQYYQRVLNLLDKDFESEEEKGIFMANIVKELKENVLKVSQTRIGGTLLEKVLHNLDISDFCALLEGLSKDWEVVCSSKSASFVVQAFVKLARHHLLDEAINTISSSTSSFTQDQLHTQQTHLLQLLLEGLASFLTSNLAFHMQHHCVSHVIRGFLEFLSCRKVAEDVVFGRKSNSFKENSQKAKVEKLYVREVRKVHRKKMSESLFKMAATISCLPKLEDHALNTFSGPVIQVLIECLAGINKEKSREVMDKLIESLKMFDGTTEEEGESKPSPILLHASGSRMVECILKHSSDASFQCILDRHFKGHLVTLATHNLGIFVLQSLVESARTPQQFQSIYSELRDQLESLLALNHAPLLIKLLSTSSRLCACQELVLEDLMKAFHCTDDKVVFARLLIMLVTHETLYGEDATVKEDDSEEGAKEEGGDDINSEAFKTVDDNLLDRGQSKLLSAHRITTHGCMMLGQLLRMQDTAVVLESMRALGREEVEVLAMHGGGCRVFEALMESPSVSVKEKKAWMKLLKGNYVRLACNKFGSRTFDAIWKAADDKRKEIIRKELRTHVEKLRSDKFGHFVFLKCGFNERKRKKASS